MNGKTNFKMNIGASSLVLILIVLVLSTLGILSLSGAKNDLNLAEKNADAVKSYYDAANRAESFIRETDRKLQDLTANGADRRLSDAASLFGDAYNDKDRTVSADIGMDSGRALRVSLSLACKPELRYTLIDYTVYISDDYKIDQARPVWTGN